MPGAELECSGEVVHLRTFKSTQMGDVKAPPFIDLRSEVV